MCHLAVDTEGLQAVPSLEVPPGHSWHLSALALPRLSAGAPVWVSSLRSQPGVCSDWPGNILGQNGDSREGAFRGGPELLSTPGLQHRQCHHEGHYRDT